MNVNDFQYDIDRRGPCIGLSLYRNDTYLATYMSMIELFTDLIWHYGVSPFDELLEKSKSLGEIIKEPYKYRGVCSEYFFPTERIMAYVCFGNSIQEIIESFGAHEKRSIAYPDDFYFCPQGIGIHLFDRQENKYRIWIGGETIHSVSELIQRAHDQSAFIPNELIEESIKLNQYDVFISHKNVDFIYAKKVYDYLEGSGFKVFLSEISLPAISNTDYSYEIDKALENSNNIVVIASSIEDVMSGWVRYEWSSFANELRSNRKTGNIITLLYNGVTLEKLPFLLRQYETLNETEYKKVADFIK